VPTRLEGRAHEGRGAGASTACSPSNTMVDPRTSVSRKKKAACWLAVCCSFLGLILLSPMIFIWFHIRCQDQPDFLDKDGDGCDAYENDFRYEMEEWGETTDCANSEEYVNGRGVHAGVACCVCGGGSVWWGLEGYLPQPRWVVYPALVLEGGFMLLGSLLILLPLACCKYKAELETGGSGTSSPSRLELRALCWVICSCVCPCKNPFIRDVDSSELSAGSIYRMYKIWAMYCTFLGMMLLGIVIGLEKRVSWLRQRGRMYYQYNSEWWWWGWAVVLIGGVLLLMGLNSCRKWNSSSALYAQRLDEERRQRGRRQRQVQTGAVASGRFVCVCVCACVCVCQKL
jgi:hypothetical protein